MSLRGSDDDSSSPQPGSTVTGRVVLVPAVVGISLAEAQRRLEEAGLRTLLLQSESPGAVVQSQDPPAGVKTLEGTAVTLYLGGQG